MTFTDDDLKELKGLFGASVYWSPKIPALVARLEEAENVCNEVERAQRHGNVSDDFIEPMEAWRKAAGK